MIRIKLLWHGKNRLVRAYTHFRKYRKHYESPKELLKLLGGKRQSPIQRAVRYVIENPRSFDDMYFRDMEKHYDKEDADASKKFRKSRKTK